MKPQLALVAAIALFCLYAHAQSTRARRYRDPTSGVAIQIPDGWRIDRESSALTITSFDPKDRPPQLLVPVGEAQIVVTGPPEGIESIQSWMKSERIQESRGYYITTASITTKYFGTLLATVAKLQPEVIPEGTLLVYFLNLHDRPVKVALFYRGEKRAEYFENIQKTVIENLEVNQ